MNKIPNRQAICEELIDLATNDKDIVVLCSDSRGSASLAPFANQFPEQFVEVGIAEQNLVSISAGLAVSGKKPFCASPASFLSTRSYEQVKVDCAYTGANVTLIGISGGVSYGALGMTHHSAQDIAAICSIPNMRCYLSSDRFQSAKLIRALYEHEKPAYLRVGRNAVEDVYTAENCPFTLDKANVIHEGNDAVIIACGEMVHPALEAAKNLEADGVHAAVVDMYCVKPLDTQTILDTAKDVKLVVTVEEHSPYGGLGSMVAQVVGANCPKKVINLALPDEPVITGTSPEVFAHYGLDATGIAKTVRENLNG